MNDTPQEHLTQDTVLERIRSGELTMHSRSFFILKSLLILALSALVLLLSVWLASFISFGLRITGHDSLLGFGTRGLALFLTVFPWQFLVLDIILIALLVWLLQRFRFIYRTPILIVLGVLFVLGAASGLLFDRETRFHTDLFEHAEAGELPSFVEGLYKSASPVAPEDRGVYRGFVTNSSPGVFLMTHDDRDRGEDDGSWMVIVPAGYDTGILRIGDKVYVAGDREGTSIRAYGVRVLEHSK